MSSQGYGGISGHDERRWAHPNHQEQDTGNDLFGQHHHDLETSARGNIDPILLRQIAHSPISPEQNTRFADAFDAGLLFLQPSSGIAAAGDEPWIPESYEIDPSAASAVEEWYQNTFGDAESQSIGRSQIQQTGYLSAAPMESQYAFPQTAAYASAPAAEMAPSYVPYTNMHAAPAPPLHSPLAGPSNTRPSKRQRMTSPVSGPSHPPEITCLGLYDSEKAKTKTCTSKPNPKADPEGLRCTKCHTANTRLHAQPKHYPINPATTLPQALTTLYPPMPGLAHPQDDVHTERFRETAYITRLGHAVSTPYLDDHTTSKTNTQRLRQQTKLNRKPHDSPQYTSDLVQKRLLLLFHTAISYHAGGPSFYDIGGDNYGYGEDKDLIFSQRVGDIIEMLTSDKDIVMDVVEGRGVTALVRNPDKYQRRKRDNKKSNDTKADLQEKGKRVVELEGRGSVGVSGSGVGEGDQSFSFGGFGSGE